MRSEAPVRLEGAASAAADGASPGAGRPEPGVAVSVRGLGKRFKLYARPGDRLLEWASFGAVRRHEEFWALRDVTFDVRAGECLGIIGVNGAGKSTLLKILSGALHPTAGAVAVNGRVSSLLELGTGFQPELTGRQNLFQSAELLGFPAGYVQARLPAILEFADIGEFIDRPVRQYSSGMFVRLAFSLFAHLDPDVYIVDEALSVGDVFFQQRCFRRFRELRERGCTILFVSHDMEAVTHLCDRVLLLHGGKVTAAGDPVAVVHDYFALSGQAWARSREPAPAIAGAARRGGDLDLPEAVQRRLAAGTPAAAHAAAGSRATEIVGFTVADLAGEERWTVETGHPLRFWYLIEARERCPDLNVGIHFYDRRGILAFGTGTANRGVRLPPLDPGERIAVALTVRLNLQPGEYTLVPQSGGLTGGRPEPGVLHDRLESLPAVTVTRPPGAIAAPFYGLANLPTEVEWSALEPSPAVGGGASAR